MTEVGDAGRRVRELCEWGGAESDNLKQQVTSSGMAWLLVFL